MQVAETNAASGCYGRSRIRPLFELDSHPLEDSEKTMKYISGI
jgi:hypothetical protein